MESISVRIKLFIIGLLIFASLPTAAQARFEAGLLTCEVEAGVALIMSSPRDLHCVFHKSDGLNEAYGGTRRSGHRRQVSTGHFVTSKSVISRQPPTPFLAPGTQLGGDGNPKSKPSVP